MRLLATFNLVTASNDIWFDFPESFNAQFDEDMCNHIQNAQDMLVENEPESAVFTIKIPLSDEFQKELFFDCHFDSDYYANYWLEVNFCSGDLSILLVMQTTGDFSCIEYEAMPYIKSWSEVLNDDG